MHIAGKTVPRLAFDSDAEPAAQFYASWQIVPTVIADLISDADAAKPARAVQAMPRMKKRDIAALKAGTCGLSMTREFLRISGCRRVPSHGVAFSFEIERARVAIARKFGSEIVAA